MKKSYGEIIAMVSGVNKERMLKDKDYRKNKMKELLEIQNAIAYHSDSTLIEEYERKGVEDVLKILASEIKYTSIDSLMELKAYKDRDNDYFFKLYAELIAERSQEERRIRKIENFSAKTNFSNPSIIKMHLAMFSLIEMAFMYLEIYDELFQKGAQKEESRADALSSVVVECIKDLTTVSIDNLRSKEKTEEQLSELLKAAMMLKGNVNITENAKSKLFNHIMNRTTLLIGETASIMSENPYEIGKSIKSLFSKTCKSDETVELGTKACIKSIISILLQASVTGDAMEVTCKNSETGEIRSLDTTEILTLCSEPDEDQVESGYLKTIIMIANSGDCEDRRENRCLLALRSLAIVTEKASKMIN